MHYNIFISQEWNDELAGIAQTYADQCMFIHNDDRSSQSTTYTSVGENLFVTSSQQVNYTQFVEAWYGEVMDYDYTSNTCQNGSVCGHYTQVGHHSRYMFCIHTVLSSVEIAIIQVVWADSDMVGCGVRRCATVVDFNPPNSLLLVCNYGPA